MQVLPVHCTDRSVGRKTTLKEIQTAILSVENKLINEPKGLTVHLRLKWNDQKLLASGNIPMHHVLTSCTTENYVILCHTE